MASKRRLRRSHDSNSPPDPLKSGFLREKLQAWMWEQSLHTQEFTCSLPQACTEYKCIELPPHAASEQASLIKQALHEHCGANEQELACDYWLTTSNNQPPTTSLHLTWTNPTFLNLLHAECQAVGLQCRVIDAQPFVLTRIAGLSTNADRGSLVIDLGASTRPSLGCGTHNRVMCAACAVWRWGRSCENWRILFRCLPVNWNACYETCNGIHHCLKLN